MKQISVKALQYFAGRVVTVFIKGQLQRTFNDRQFNDYFVGMVDWINEDGLMTTHSQTGCKNFFSLEDIAFIVEEQVLDPQNPQEAEIIKELTKPIPQTDSPFADINVLENLARQAKEQRKK